MSFVSEDDKTESENYEKVVQLYNAIKENLNVKYIEKILLRNGDINVEIPKICNTIWTHQNLLHFTFSRNNIEFFKLLLDRNADYTIKNRVGRTIIHRAIEDECYGKKLLGDRFEDIYIDLVLSAQLKSGNSANICSDYGISHFHAACMTNNVEAVEFFLKNGVSVEQTVPKNSPIFAGFTPLHFAARYSCFQSVKILLKYGANVRSKNAENKTPLNILIERKINKAEFEVGNANEKIIQLLLKQDVAVNKDFSAIDDFGLSNLHISCVLKDTSMVESILEKTVDINQSIEISSPFCAGYTPLHFAALFNVKIVELLINRGADIEIEDVSGVTAFDLCLQRFRAEDIHFILASKQEWKNIVLSDNKAKLLDLVSAMQNTEKLLDFIDNNEFDVKSTVPIDSQLWPGYTLLHLAVIFSEQTRRGQLEEEWIDDCNKIEECLNEGAKLTTTDAKGSTALHLAFYLKKPRCVALLLKHHWTTENPHDSNNLSHFHIACATGDQDAVERFLCGDIDVDDRVNSTIEWHHTCNHDSPPKIKSFIAPGSSALHMNAANGNSIITEMLLDEDADIYAKDIDGFTPIHRLLTTCTCSSGKIGDLLLNIDRLEDCVGPGGLSYLHVACHLQTLRAIQKFLESGSDINASITCSNYSGNIKSAKACNEFSDSSEEPLSFLFRYSDFTPLHFSMQKGNFETNCLLIKNGADIFAKSLNNTFSPIHEILRELTSYCEVIIPIFMNNDAWRQRAKEEFGLTMLHIACCVMNPSLCADLINQGEDANGQVHMNSSAWAGYTPLHFAAIKAAANHSENDVNLKKIFDLLMDNGADVTLANGEGDTALHLLYKRTDHLHAGSIYTNLLLKSIQNFDVNPTDERGISFFHIACMENNVDIVKKYLYNGVNVDQPIGYFSDKYPGYSPLHLAAGDRSKSSKHVTSQLETVNLLLEHNADIHAQNSFINTPLHEAAGCETSFREGVLTVIVSKTSNLNTENVFGETALEILLKTGSAKWHEIKYFLERGCSMNSYNSFTQEGFIPRIFTNSKTREEYALENPTLREFINSQYITEIDSNGRSCLHNLISMGYFYIYDQVQLIKQFVDRGCDINRQDDEGRTALHRATLFKNNRGVFALIKNGADINITDNYGKTAFSYAFEEGFPRDIRSQEDYHDPEHVIKNIASHVYKMMLCKLDVCKLNQQLLANSSEKYPLWERVIDRWNYSKERAKKAKIGSTSMTLYDFLFKIDAEIAYPKMSNSERQEIDDFLENISDYKCCAIDYLVKHKIEKGYEMMRLISRVTNILSILAKQQLPQKCCQIILKFLSSSDMKNLVSAIS